MCVMRYFFACLFLCCTALAQPVQTQVNADCIIQFDITASGGTIPSSGGFDNRQIGCNSWQLSYGNFGFSGLSLVIQSAPDNNNTPGSWGTLGGTATFGTNPLTNTSGASNLIQSYGTNFADWVRVSLSSATGMGFVRGVLLGYRAAGSAGTSGGGGASSNVNLTQVASVNVASDGNGGIVPGGASTAAADGISNTQILPQFDNAGTPGAGVSRIFPYVFNGSTWDRDFTCPNSVQVALSGTAYTQIVAASGSTVIRVCKIFVTSASAGSPVVNTFNVAFGACAGTPTQIFTAAGVTGFDEDFGGALRSAASGALCVKESTANSDLVTATYVQY